MQITVLDRIAHDHEAILRAADGIKAVLSRPATRGDLDRVVFDVLDFHERRLRPHLEVQDRAILSVARENEAVEGSVAVEETRIHMARLWESTLMMRREVEVGTQLRGVLENAEMVMREYLQFSRKALLPWIEDHLGPEHLVEAEGRYRDIIKQPGVEAV